MTGINQFHLLLSYFYEVASSENKTQSQSHDLIGPDNDIYLLFQLHFLPLNFSHFILLLSSICWKFKLPPLTFLPALYLGCPSAKLHLMNSH